MDASDEAERRRSVTERFRFLVESGPAGLARMERFLAADSLEGEGEDDGGASFEASGSSAQSDSAPHRDEMVRRADEILEAVLTARFSGGVRASNFVDGAHEKRTRGLARAHVGYLKQKLHAGDITKYDLKRETIVTAECVMCCPFTNAERNEHDCSCGLMQRIAFFANPEDEALNKEWQECHKGQHAQIANLLLQSTVCRCAYYVGFPTREPIKVLAELEPHPVRCRSRYTRLLRALWKHRARATLTPAHPTSLPSSCPGCGLRKQTRRE